MSQFVLLYEWEQFLVVLLHTCEYKFCSYYYENEVVEGPEFCRRNLVQEMSGLCF